MLRTKTYDYENEKKKILSKFNFGGEKTVGHKKYGQMCWAPKFT
jgi:hypothetical protein